MIARPFNPSDYKILFAVILGRTQNEDIPFFSKVSFKDAAELTLEMMGFTCEFHYVHTEPQAGPQPNAGAASTV